jgi:DNA-binding Lrp family transcriptional regulator
LEKGKGKMKKGEWAFLTNHGRVLAYLTKHPRSTAQKIAQDANLSIRAVQSIITDLEKEGYITRQREGRCNNYKVYTDRPMRNRLEGNHIVGDMLLAIGATSPKQVRKFGV